MGPKSKLPFFAHLDKLCYCTKVHVPSACQGSDIVEKLLLDVSHPLVAQVFLAYIKREKEEYGHNDLIRCWLSSLEPFTQ